MKIPRWIAVAITVAWVVQLSTLWPLPPDAIAQMKANLAVSTTPLPLEALDELEASAWISWFTWAAIVPIGIASGVLAARGHRWWVAMFAAAAGAYLVILCPWRLAIALHGHSFSSLTSFASHGEWILGHPMMLFATILFPMLIVGVSGYLVISVMQIKGRHAI